MTSQELAAYHARRCRIFDKAMENKGCDREAELHEQIFSECRRRGWIALHGAMSERTHRTAGEPDFVIMTDLEDRGSYVPKTLLIECKTKTGKLSPAQAALHAQAAKLGHSVHVVRSFEEFLKLL